MISMKMTESILYRYSLNVILASGYFKNLGVLREMNGCWCAGLGLATLAVSAVRLQLNLILIEACAVVQLCASDRSIWPSHSRPRYKSNSNLSSAGSSSLKPLTI